MMAFCEHKNSMQCGEVGLLNGIVPTKVVALIISSDICTTIFRLFKISVEKIPIFWGRKGLFRGFSALIFC